MATKLDSTEENISITGESSVGQRGLRQPERQDKVQSLEPDAWLCPGVTYPLCKMGTLLVPS